MINHLTAALAEVAKQINAKTQCDTFEECREKKECLRDNDIRSCCPEFQFERKIKENLSTKNIDVENQHNVTLDQFSWTNLVSIKPQQKSSFTANPSLHVDLKVGDNFLIEIKKIQKDLYPALANKVAIGTSNEWGKNPFFVDNNKTFLVAKHEGEIWLDINRLINAKRFWMSDSSNTKIFLIGFTAFKINPKDLIDRLHNAINHYKTITSQSCFPEGYIFSQLDQKKKPNKTINAMLPSGCFNVRGVTDTNNQFTNGAWKYNEKEEIYCAYLIEIMS